MGKKRLAPGKKSPASKKRAATTRRRPQKSGPTDPTVTTVKRLFALSGNRCAFPNCTTPLIDPKSASVLGEICHIKGRKPGAPRYDKKQSDEERHGFANLILLCSLHHKVIDDDQVAYTIRRLVQMKQQHEAKHKEKPPVDTATAKQFVAVSLTNCRVHGSVVASHGQTGGQTAGVIHNTYVGSPAKGDEAVRVDAKLDMLFDAAFLAMSGCPGMRVTVACRSTRQARIQRAYLLIDDVDVMKAMQAGFGSDLGFKQAEGTKQAMTVDLVPMSPPNSPNGFVLSQDDVCRLFYPLPLPSTHLMLRAKPEDLSIWVQFFDNSEQILATDRSIKETLETIWEVWKERAGQFRGVVHFGVRATSSTKPKIDMVGQTNPHHAPIVDLDTT